MTDTLSARERADLAIAQLPFWYHQIQLAPDVRTPGLVDLDRLADKAIPDLTGKRCLDVATFDGYWSFAMERRGAAEIIAIDVDDVTTMDHPPLRREKNLAEFALTPSEPGQGFRLAAGVLGSGVRRKACNVYDLDLDVTEGPVDFVFIGAILQHLRNPVAAMERIASVLQPGGQVVAVEQVSIALTVFSPRRPAADFRAANPANKFTWWVPNWSCLRSWGKAAGLHPTSKVPQLYRTRSRAVGRGERTAVVRWVKP